MLTLILCFILIAALFFAAVIIYDCSRFVVRRYEVASAKVKKPCRYILLADLHNKSFGRSNEKLVAAIDRLQPDGVLMAGDMITAAWGEDAAPACCLVKALCEKYPVYYGVGNHEYRAKLYPDVYGSLGTDYENALLDMGVTPLCNLHTMTPEGMDVCGIAIDKEYYRKFRHMQMDAAYVEELAGRANENAFQILIAHNPQYFEAYAAWGADLTVSGHVHGGVMRLPVLGGVISPAFKLFPKYDGGMFELGGRKMIISRGLGTHTIPVRIFNPGELIVIDIHP